MEPLVLTNGILQKRLQIANCCASKKGVAVIAKQKKGFDCTGELNVISEVIDHVDALKDYINIIPDTSAIMSYSAASWIPGIGMFNLIATFNFQLGGSNIKAVTNQPTVDAAFLAMEALINSLGYGNIASYNSATNLFVMIAPPNTGAEGNSYTVTWSATGPTPPIMFPTNTAQFSGGVDGNMDVAFNDTGLCLTTNEIETILDRLCKLCSDPCETYVNFES